MGNPTLFPKIDDRHVESLPFEAKPSREAHEVVQPLWDDISECEMVNFVKMGRMTGAIVVSLMIGARSSTIVYREAFLGLVEDLHARRYT